MITLRCSSLSSNLFGSMSQKDLPNSPSSFIGQKLSRNYFFEWKCQALILSEKISDGYVFFFKECRKGNKENVGGSILIEISIDCVIITYPMLM